MPVGACHRRQTVSEGPDVSLELGYCIISEGFRAGHTPLREGKPGLPLPYASRHSIGM